MQKPSVRRSDYGVSKKINFTARLFFLPHHSNGLFWAFVRTDATTLTEPKVNKEFFIDRTVRAVHRTEPARVTFLFVDDGPEYPPRPGLPGSSFYRPAYSQTLAFCTAAHILISL